MATLTTLPPGLHSKLSALTRRMRWLRALRRISLVLTVLILTGAAALLLDYALELSSVIRTFFLLGWLILGCALTLFGVIVPLLRLPSAEALAAAIEEKYPDLGERLTSVIELAEVQDRFHGSPELIHLLTQETETRTQRLNFTQALPAQHAARLAATAGAVMILALLPSLLWPRYTLELGRRFLLPWQTPGGIVLYQVEIRPGDVVTAQGRPLAFAVRLVPEIADARLPRTCFLVVTDAEGNTTRTRMFAGSADEFTFQMENVSGNLRYHAAAGDATSPTYQVTAVEPVQLAVDSPTITITPPAYAGKTVAAQTIQGLADLTALQHSKLQVAFRFTRPAAAATLEWTVQKDKHAETVNRPLELTADALGATWLAVATANGQYRVILEAEHGIRTELEPRNLTVKPDLPPSFQKVEISGAVRRDLLQRRDESLKVLAYENIPLELALTDDIGVDRLDLEYRVNEGMPQTEPLPLEGRDSRKAVSRSQLKLADKTLKEGDQVQYRFKLADNRRVPEAGLEPQVVVYPDKDRWLTLKITRDSQPLEQQEIAAQRTDLQDRLEAIKRDLQKEQRELYKLRRESRDQAALNSDQARQLRQLGDDNQAAATALRELARATEEIPGFQSLAQKARDVAQQELERSGKALEESARESQPESRERDFDRADRELTAALRKLDEMQQLHNRLAQERMEQAKLDTLAEREQQLANRAAEQAAADPAKDPGAQEQAAQLQQQQRELSAELKRLGERSEPVRRALEAARAEEVERLAQKTRELAQKQRDLAQAAKDTQKQIQDARLAELARKQQQLAEQAERLAKKTRQASQVAQTPPLRPDSAQQAARALTRQNTNEALQLQDRSRQELERLARELNRALEQARDPRESARQLSRLQEALRQQLKEDTQKNGGQAPKAERLQALQREQESLQKAVEKLPVPDKNPTAQKESREATQRAAQAKDALQQRNVPKANEQMKAARQALERLAGQLPGMNQPSQTPRPEPQRTVRAQAEETTPPPEGLPNQEQANQARALAREQGELRDELQRLVNPAAQADRLAQQSPAAELVKEQQAIAKQAGELKQAVAKEQPGQAAAQQAAQAAQSAKRTANQLGVGALANAKQAGQQTAQQLRQLSQTLDQSAQPADGKPNPQREQARQLAQRQEELNRRLQPLAGNREAQQAQQQAGQRQLQQQAAQLQREFDGLRQSMPRANQAQASAQRAAESSRQARSAMQQAQERGREGRQEQAFQARQQAAQNLEQAAQLADQAVQQLQQAAAQGTPPPNARQTGQQLQQAQASMQQAEGNLAQNQNQAARNAMERAAQGLRQASQQLAQAQGPRQPSPTAMRPNQGEPALGAVVDPSLLGKDAKKFAGKRWGELPGELRTKIIQDVQSRYGADYARIIKLYFEQIADTKK
jgi:hypothetical protein